jgi:hypothetical protein
VALFWAALHFDVGGDLPDRWVLPVLGLVTALNVLQTIWSHFGKRKLKDR